MKLRQISVMRNERKLGSYINSYASRHQVVLRAGFGGKQISDVLAGVMTRGAQCRGPQTGLLLPEQIVKLTAVQVKVDRAGYVADHEKVTATRCYTLR